MSTWVYSFALAVGCILGVLLSRKEDNMSSLLSKSDQGVVSWLIFMNFGGRKYATKCNLICSTMKAYNLNCDHCQKN